MPRIVPSLVVGLIERVYPNMDRDAAPHLSPGEARNVGGILAPYDQLGEEHFGRLTSDEYATLLMSAAMTREMLESWHAADFRERSNNKPEFTASPAVGGRHPLQVIRDTLKKCPDDAVSPAAHDLNFLGDPALAETLQLDMSTAFTALGNGEFKAACIMAGSVIEALLLWALKRKTPTAREAARVAWAADPKAKSIAPKALPKDWGGWHLYELIEAARRMKPDSLLSDELADAADTAKNFRNMIHPERADKTKPTLGAGHIAVGVMRRVSEELETLVVSGKL